MRETPRRILVSGPFDELRSAEIRFLHEASRLGELHVRLLSDRAVVASTGRAPGFGSEERKYFLEAVRFVSGVEVVEQIVPPPAPAAAPGTGSPKGSPKGSPTGPSSFAAAGPSDTPALRAAVAAAGLRFELIGETRLRGFPSIETGRASAGQARPKVVVTGCYDWLHTGHIRFFEEVAALGDLYVVLGNDANVRELKGEGHPRFPAEERRYMVSAIRHVSSALIATGMGWLDAEPEIELMKPEIYAVNADGDRPEKRAFCEARGMRYVVLERTPRQGLPRRSSTELRGF